MLCKRSEKSLLSTVNWTTLEQTLRLAEFGNVPARCRLHKHMTMRYCEALYYGSASMMCQNKSVSLSSFIDRQGTKGTTSDLPYKGDKQINETIARSKVKPLSVKFQPSEGPRTERRTVCSPRGRDLCVSYKERKSKGSTEHGHQQWSNREC